MPVFNTSLFTASSSNHSYFFNPADFSSEFKRQTSLILPLAHDSEWYDKTVKDFLTDTELKNRLHLSTQVKHIFNKPYCFFTDYAIGETGYSDLLPMECDFIVCDYLKRFGIESFIKYKETEKLPYLDVYLYSFFGIVDITLLAKKDTPIYDLIKSGLADKYICHDKRLTTSWNRPVSLPVVISIADINKVYHDYQLRLFFIDIGAILGNAGYKKVCENVGLDVSAKSLMDNYKSDMLTGLKEYPYEFIKYANGDLNVYDVLVAFNDLMKDVYKDLDFSDYFLSPKLTIGSTVADIVAASVFKWQGLPASDYHLKENKKSFRKTKLVELMGLSSSDYLKTQLVKSEVYLQGKVHGGRCHNNNPITRYCANAPIADYDLAGAYSSAMEKLPFFIGEPWIYNGIDEHISLKEFLRRHESDFDDWHYVIYASSNDVLEHNQDFLVSWLNIKADKQRLKNDNGDFSYISIADYKSGNCQIFQNEVVNTPITSDTVKWIRSLSKDARNEMLDKLYVHSAIGYKRKDKNVKWQSINLGKLLISPLKRKRSEYKKLYKEIGDNRYNSLQELFKLIMNTVYGVMCSQYFTTSNVVVANQITQIIRLGMYIMEKGLYLIGAITDGCMGNLNKVLYMLRKGILHFDKLSNLYRYDKHKLGSDFQLRLGALDNAKNIVLTWFDGSEFNQDGSIKQEPKLTVTYANSTKVLTGSNAVKAWIDEKAWQHLKNLFPQFAYLLDFLKIETKDVYSSFIYHGAANYRLKNPNYAKYAMRGYSGKKNSAIGVEYDIETDSLIRINDYDNQSIPQLHLNGLTSGVIKKLPVFIKTKILKSKEFSDKRYNERSSLVCGDNVIEVGMPNYCSLSQYTFKTVAQYEKWKSAFSRLKRKYGESFEVFFTNQDGTLRYDDMVKELSELVNSNCHTPLKVLNEKYLVRVSIVATRYLTKLKASILRNHATFTFDELELETAIELED